MTRLLDSQLAADERQVRKRRRIFAQKALQPRIRDAFRNESNRPPSSAKWATWVCSARLTCRRNTAALASTYVLRPDRPRDRARRFGLPDAAQRAVLAGHAAHLRLRQRRAEAEIPAETGQGELIGCFGLTEPNSVPTPAAWLPVPAACRRLEAVGQQELDFQRPAGRRLHRLGQDDDAVIRGFILDKGMAGLSAPVIHGKVGLRARSPAKSSWTRCSCRPRTCCPGVSGLKGPFHLSELGALRHRLGRWVPPRPWHTARQYTLDRKQFDKPLAANQLVQKSSPTCRPKSPSASRARCVSAA